MTALPILLGSDNLTVGLVVLATVREALGESMYKFY